MKEGKNMSLTSLQSLTLNLGPCILRREVYTSEQLDSLVLSDDNSESITQIVFDHFGINIVNDYQDTMVLLEAVFESDDLSIQMKKGIEKFCLEKMKELEGQPEYLGHYLAFAWGVLSAWEAGTWRHTIEEFLQRNPELRDEFDNLWGDECTY